MASRYNYRKYYKKYYGIEFDSNYDIHHIDLNKNNNDISNLLLLPKKLHQKYHNCLYSCGVPLDPNGFYKIYYELKDLDFFNYQLGIIQSLFEVMNECLVWIRYKYVLDNNISTKNK